MIVGIIHAKRHSTRIPNKNLKKLGNKPLFCHILDTALTVKGFDKVIIDSDSQTILNIGSKRGAIPLLRPKSLASNQATGDDLAYWGARNNKESDIIISLLPTAPFLKKETIENAINILCHTSYDSIISSYKEALYTWKNNKPQYLRNHIIPNSFSMEPIIYETTGMYASKTKFILEHKKRLNPNNTKLLSISKIEAIDINNLEDFKLAEIVWKGLHV